MKWNQIEQIKDGIKIPTNWVYLHYYEAFNLLFRIENALRIFVYIVLKNQFGEKWIETQIPGDGDSGTILSLAKKRMNQAHSFGYLGYNIECPIMHLNGGELTRIIVSKTYWPIFEPYFSGSQEIIKNKFIEIGSIRNSLAHFRPIRADDVDVIKQNSKHILLNIESFLYQVLVQDKTVPTNTPDEWYINLSLLKSELCTFKLHQSDDEKWIRILMTYNCPILHEIPGNVYIVLTVKSSAILKKYSAITNNICYLTESPKFPYEISGTKKIRIAKKLSFVISISSLNSHYLDIKKSFIKILDQINKETDLIGSDNLAKGEFIHSAPISATLNTEEEFETWKWSCPEFTTPVIENDPTEYWGNITFSPWNDIISSTTNYPWMPTSISS